MTGDREPTSVVQTPFLESSGMLSPNGRWVAFHSNASGERQVVVQSVASDGGLYQISTDGGLEPRWRGDGRELFYVSPDDELMAVDIAVDGDALQVGIPHRLFQVAFKTQPQRNVFDVTADGQKFLVNALVDGAGSVPITWVLNWTAELEQ